jgi:hypothetical protein
MSENENENNDDYRILQARAMCRIITLEPKAITTTLAERNKPAIFSANRLHYLERQQFPPVTWHLGL